MEYNFREIEKKWHEYWIANKVYKVEKNADKPKYYVLDMFPYPSGAGLHVGHPLGYIASDIYSRYKRLQGFNVLHPMGYDAYGLPAEQYAIQTGQHPEVTTKKNIARYREQMDKIGFSYDWNREIRTCDPEYYKWTQWAFIQMFNSYYCNDKKQARPISELVAAFEQSGTEGLNVACSEELHFTAGEWKAKNDKEKQEILLNYRIAYRGETMVNWCAALGTVLANDEVVNGVSERGGYPVEQKIMRQWCLRVSAYAQRLLDGLETIDWTDSLKETQRNWIGRSEGAEIQFKVKDSDLEFTIFTTRADTMFGVTFMVLAPESELVAQLTTPEQKQEVDAYLDRTKKRTGCFRLEDSGYLPFHHPKQPEYPVVTSIFPSTGSYPLCTSGKQPRRPDREKHIAKGFRLVRSAETKKGRHHFYLLPGYRKPFFRLLSTRGHMGGKLQQETTRRSRPNPTKPAKLPATRPRPPAQVIRQKRPFEPDGTIGQSRPLCFPPRFNRMGYPKRLVRRRSFHE